MVEKKILLIGCGGIGIRHVESLICSFRNKIQIAVIDSAYSGSDQLRRKIRETTSANVDLSNVHLIRYDCLDDYYDFTLVATTSKARDQLLDKKFFDSAGLVLIEKPIFSNVKYYSKNFNYPSKTFVNYSRRMWPVYSELRTFLDGQPSSSLHFEISGFNWLLGSNIFHFFDLFVYLSGEIPCVATCKINSVEMSKRHGYSDIDGEVVARSDEGSTFCAKQVLDRERVESYKLRIRKADFVCEIDETNGQISDNYGKVRSFEIPYQSQLTAIFLNLPSEKSPLTLFADAYEQEKVIYNAIASEIKTKNLGEIFLT